MKKNIIFLDIDGVLNSGKSFRKNQKLGVPQSCIDLPYKDHVEALNMIIDRCDAYLVITSTWRLYFSLRSLDKIFYLCGIRGDRIIDKTEDLSMTDGDHGVKRSVEIEKYIKNNSDKIKNYVIIDDDCDAKIKNHFVKTEFHCGLNEGSARLAIKILGDSEIGITQDFDSCNVGSTPAPPDN